MDFDAFYHDEVYARACEIQSPNSPDFEEVLEAVDNDIEFNNKCWEGFLRQRAAFLTPEQVNELRAAKSR